jgi:hypothetical protein
MINSTGGPTAEQSTLDDVRASHPLSSEQKTVLADGLLAIAHQVCNEPNEEGQSLNHWLNWLDEQEYDQAGFLDALHTICQRLLSVDDYKQLVALASESANAPNGYPLAIDYLSEHHSALLEQIEDLEKWRLAELEVMLATAGGLGKKEKIGIIAGAVYVTAGVTVGTIIYFRERAKQKLIAELIAKAEDRELTRRDLVEDEGKRLLRMEESELKQDLIQETTKEMGKEIRKEISLGDPKNIIEKDFSRDKGLAKIDARNRADEILDEYDKQIAQELLEHEKWLLDNEQLLLNGNPAEFLKKKIIDNPAEFSLDDNGLKRYTEDQIRDQRLFFDQKLKDQMAQHVENLYQHLGKERAAELIKYSIANDVVQEQIKKNLKLQAEKLLNDTIKNSNLYAKEFEAIHLKYKILEYEMRREKYAVEHDKLANSLLTNDRASLNELIEKIRKTKLKIEKAKKIINDAKESQPSYEFKKSHLYQALENQEGMLHEAYGAIRHQLFRTKKEKILDKSLDDILNKSDLEVYKTELDYFRYNAIQSLRQKYGDGFANLVMDKFKFTIVQEESEIDTFIVSDILDAEETIIHETEANIKNELISKEDAKVFDKIQKEKTNLETILEADLEEEEDLWTEKFQMYENFFNSK